MAVLTALDRSPWAICHLTVDLSLLLVVRRIQPNLFALRVIPELQVELELRLIEVDRAHARTDRYSSTRDMGPGGAPPEGSTR
jgi:hypothetical protein